MTSRVEGTEQVIANIQKLKENLGQEIFKALIAGGEEVVSTARKSIQNKSSGRAVTRTTESGNSYPHIAAAAGLPPNTDTGFLVGSINLERGSNEVFVGSQLEYAGWLEYGTSKMLPRPFLNPAVEQNRRRIVKRVQDAVNKTTERGDNP